MHVATAVSPAVLSLCPWPLVQYSFNWSVLGEGWNRRMYWMSAWQVPQNSGMSVVLMERKPFSLEWAPAKSELAGSPPWQSWQRRPFCQWMSAPTSFTVTNNRRRSLSHSSDSPWQRMQVLSASGTLAAAFSAALLATDASGFFGARSPETAFSRIALGRVSAAVTTVTAATSTAGRTAIPSVLIPATPRRS